MKMITSNILGFSICFLYCILKIQTTIMPGSDFEKMDDGTFRKKMDNTMNLDTCKKQAAPVAMWTWGHIHTKF